ncbi:Nudix hydrolase 2 [Vitis vinifera]|uniref:Nudix hydrolase 2 n=1 Tax=Vitis vinifera TaxID=29760 RepID=A0A438IEC6_VITVI|nr:Nudix hydrolase 2 [Vitis vinifera]
MLVDEQMVPENSVQQIELLTTTDDDYGGVHVEIKNSMDSNVFGDLLRASILQWRQKVLVVQENSGIFKGTGVWKLPTGVVNEGEDICTAAIREVEEETGIKTEFVEVLSFMQSHKAFFTKSDLFFVCMLQPLSSEIQKQDEKN